MKRTALLLAVLAAALVAASGVALAATFGGTNNDERLVGTRYADTIKARGGNDVVLGLGGNDAIRGDDGNDRLSGGPGNDRIVSRDVRSPGGANRDVVRCGGGNDTAFVDSRDRVVDCERRR
jgi:Ca2+-binding RTX toxin-like protein